MRAAEILVELLLEDTKIRGILYGPDIPNDGYWVSGQNLGGMVHKMAQGLGADPKGSVAHLIDTLIANNYVLVTNALAFIPGTKTKVITLFGRQKPKLTPSAIRILHATGLTPVHVYNRFHEVPQKYTARQIFGIPLTPNEIAQAKAARAQAKSSQNQWHGLSPEEEEQFAQDALQQHQLNPQLPGSDLGDLGTLKNRPRPSPYRAPGEKENWEDPGLTWP